MNIHTHGIMKTEIAIETKYATVTAAALPIAEKLARGSYQRGVIRGREAISGATLKGKAKKYGIHYARSRGRLITRLKDAGLVIREKTGDHNRRELIISVTGEEI